MLEAIYNSEQWFEEKNYASIIINNSSEFSVRNNFSHNKLNC